MMSIRGFVVFAFFYLSVAAAPHPTLHRRCDVGDPDPEVVNEVYAACMARSVNSKVLLATFETAYVESKFNNLDCGNQDSFGVFQQRLSQGWGSYDQITNVRYATNAFLDRAIPGNEQNPSMSAGELAQWVQQSEFPDRYSQNEGAASDILSQAIAADGDDGSDNVEHSPSKSHKGKGKHHGGKTKGSKGSQNDETGKSKDDSNCKQSYTAKKGDTCHEIEKKFGISKHKLLSLNKDLDSDCKNLEAGQAYCVKA